MTKQLYWPDQGFAGATHRSGVTYKLAFSFCPGSLTSVTLARTTGLMQSCSSRGLALTCVLRTQAEQESEKAWALLQASAYAKVATIPGDSTSHVVKSKVLKDNTDNGHRVRIASPRIGSMYTVNLLTRTKNTFSKSTYLLLQCSKGQVLIKMFYIRKVLGRQKEDRRPTFPVPVDYSEKKDEDRVRDAC